MFYEAQMTFRRRTEPVSIVLPEVELKRLNRFVIDRSDAVGFVELATAYDQHVWLNLKKIRKILILNEGTTPAFDRSKIKCSRQYAETVDVDDPSIPWEVDLWVEGEEPLHLYELAGDEWVEIATSIDCDERFFRVSDEDDDSLVFSVKDTELVIGTEIGRYSEEQRKALSE